MKNDTPWIEEAKHFLSSGEVMKLSASLAAARHPGTFTQDDLRKVINYAVNVRRLSYMLDDVLDGDAVVNADTGDGTSVTISDSNLLPKKVWDSLQQSIEDIDDDLEDEDEVDAEDGPPDDHPEEIKMPDWMNAILDGKVNVLMSSPLNSGARAINA